MKRYLGILAPLLLLGGCIIYDQKGKCENCGEDGYDDPDNQGGNGDDPDSGNGQDTADNVPDVLFSLSPNTAAAGTTFITHLTADKADFDWAMVANVTLYNGVDILADEVNPTEMLLTLRIPADTAATSSDLLIETTDGDAHFTPDALTILPADPDNSGNNDTGC